MLLNGIYWKLSFWYLPSASYDYWAQGEDKFWGKSEPIPFQSNIYNTRPEGLRLTSALPLDQSLDHVAPCRTDTDCKESPGLDVVQVAVQGLPQLLLALPLLLQVEIGSKSFTSKLHLRS